MAARDSHETSTLAAKIGIFSPGYSIWSDIGNFERKQGQRNGEEDIFPYLCGLRCGIVTGERMTSKRLKRIRINSTKVEGGGHGGGNQDTDKLLRTNLDGEGTGKQKKSKPLFEQRPGV